VGSQATRGRGFTSKGIAGHSNQACPDGQCIRGVADVIGVSTSKK
jgi:hypothetical protein